MSGTHLFKGSLRAEARKEEGSKAPLGSLRSRQILHRQRFCDLASSLPTPEGVESRVENLAVWSSQDMHFRQYRHPEDHRRTLEIQDPQGRRYRKEERFKGLSDLELVIVYTDMQSKTDYWQEEGQWMVEDPRTWEQEAYTDLRAVDARLGELDYWWLHDNPRVTCKKGQWQFRIRQKTLVFASAQALDHYLEQAAEAFQEPPRPSLWKTALVGGLLLIGSAVDRFREKIVKLESGADESLSRPTPSDRTQAPSLEWAQDFPSSVSLAAVPLIASLASTYPSIPSSSLARVGVFGFLLAPTVSAVHLPQEQSEEGVLVPVPVKEAEPALAPSMLLEEGVSDRPKQPDLDAYNVKSGHANNHIIPIGDLEWLWDTYLTYIDPKKNKRVAKPCKKDSEARIILQSRSEGTSQGSSSSSTSPAAPSSTTFAKLEKAFGKEWEAERERREGMDVEEDVEEGVEEDVEEDVEERVLCYELIKLCLLCPDFRDQHGCTQGRFTWPYWALFQGWRSEMRSDDPGGWVEPTRPSGFNLNLWNAVTDLGNYLQYRRGSPEERKAANSIREIEQQLKGAALQHSKKKLKDEQERLKANQKRLKDDRERHWETTPHVLPITEHVKNVYNAWAGMSMQMIIYGYNKNDWICTWQDIGIDAWDSTSVVNPTCCLKKGANYSPTSSSSSTPSPNTNTNSDSMVTTSTSMLEERSLVKYVPRGPGSPAFFKSGSSTVLKTQGGVEEERRNERTPMLRSSGRVVQRGV